MHSIGFTNSMTSILVAYEYRIANENGFECMSIGQVAN